MKIHKLLLIETGTYDTMMMRPYEASDSKRHLNTLQAVTRNGQNLTAEALAGTVGSILRPTANHLGAIDIPNGWGERRYRFMMHIQDVDMMGNPREQYLTGHTDYCGGSFHTGAVDPKLRMFVTGSIQMQSLNIMTDYGRQTRTSIGSAAHVFNRQFYPGSEQVNQVAINLQRPMDVFTTLQTQDFRRMQGGSDFLDPRNTFAHENVKLSNRSNNIAPNYLSKILKAGAASHVNASMMDDSAELWGRAEGLVREEVYSTDEALFELHRRTSFGEGSSFTYSELQALCPDLHHVTKLIPLLTMTQAQSYNDVPVLPPYQAGQYDGWNGQDQNTLWATILSNTIPPLMLECMMHSVGFIIHNHTTDGQLDLKWGQIQPFASNLDPHQATALVDNFGYRLQMEAMRDLLAGSKIPFWIRAHFDVLGESQLEIAIAGGHPVPFATPTFADALFSPVLTRGAENVQKLAGQIEYFTSHLVQNPGHDLPNHYAPSAQPRGTDAQFSPILQSNGTNYHASASNL